MTIIATYRREDISIYIYDSMVTVKEPYKQLDAAFKFIAIEKNIGLFLSGDVNLWKMVVDGLEKVNGVSIKNVKDFDGPFRSEINKIVGESKRGMYEYSRALGFIRDEENKSNLQFLLELEPGRGCIITEIHDGDLKVIGSGSYVPDIEVILKEKFDKIYNIKKENLDLYNFSAECRNEMEKVIQACGPSIYKILGISTVFSVAYLVGDYFKVVGEEREGGYYSKVKGHRHKFSSLKNAKGEIQYLDHINSNKEYYLNDVIGATPDITGDIFDPRYSLDMEDPLEYHSERVKVYWLNQWVEEDDQFLWRTVDRVEFKEFKIRNKKVIIPHPIRKRLANDINEKVSITKIFNFHNIDEMYFSVSIENSEAFERELPINLLKNDWLKRYIPEFNRIYTSQSFWRNSKHIFRLLWGKLKKKILQNIVANRRNKFW